MESPLEYNDASPDRRSDSLERQAPNQENKMENTMQTKNLIQASANVVKITNLVKGNVVKLIEKDYSSLETYYGIVTDMFNDGEKTFIQICRYKKSYGSITAEIKIYEGQSELNIFPAEVEEVEQYFEDAVVQIEKSIAEKKEELDKKERALQNAKDFISMETSKKLTAASFKEISQPEYNQLKQSNTF